MKQFKKWQKILSKIDYAYQPIISIGSGKVIGYEALLRFGNVDKFDSIDDFFNQAYEDGVLSTVEVGLREKAIEKFVACKNPLEFKLFFNIDNRILHSSKFEKGRTKAFLEEKNISNSFLVFELSEKHQIDSYCDFKTLFQHYAKQDFNIALDDYGTGFSGMEVLYHIEPNYLKIDRFFIKEIHKDLKKQLFLKKLLEIAQTLGYSSIAEGIETKEEFVQCKELGFELAQGFLIQKPSLDLMSLASSYNLEQMGLESKRVKASKSEIISHLEFVPKISLDSSFKEVFSTFRNQKDLSYLVVVDAYDFPVGVIEDKSLKEYIFSQFGNELLSKKTIKDKMDKFVTKCSVANVSDSIDSILKIFSLNKAFSSVVIKEDGRYKGVLSASMMLDIVHKKQLLAARDQNPLTKLPGNSSINSYLSKCIDMQEEFVHIYFDLDNFKPYNDKYGFRNGDRIIILFAEILKSLTKTEEYMVGHIGGDDFFISTSLKNRRYEDVIETTRMIIEKFSQDVIAFYTQEDINRGFIISKDRHENINRFAFLTVSAAVLVAKPGAKQYRNQYADILADLKKSAKKSPSHMSVASLL